MGLRLPTTKLLAVGWQRMIPAAPDLSLSLVVDQEIFAAVPDVIYPNATYTAITAMNPVSPTSSSYFPVVWNQLEIVDATGRSTGSFLRIGHSLCALILAICGSYLSRILYQATPVNRTSELPQVTIIE